MRQTKTLQAIHQEALDTFDEIVSAQQDERLQCISDRRFAAIPGAQWEGNLGEQFENRPKFEVNKIQYALIRIYNEYRNNAIGITFTAKDGSEDKTAEIAASLLRADEQDSNGQEAYDNCFEEGVAGGYGAFRLRACYENEDDPEDERQRVKVEPLFDADQTVYFSLDGKRQDKADATRCFVLTSMTHAAYKEMYGQDPTSWPKQEETKIFDWYTPEYVYVAEYYKVTERGAELFIYENAAGEERRINSADFDEEEDLLEAKGELETLGFVFQKSRKIKTREVRKYIMDGRQVLEDCGRIAGKHIPIVPFYGRRWYVDGIERFMGHVRLAKDPQRIKNMQLSKLAEISAQSSTEKPIFTPEQIAGNQTYWEDDPIKNYPYMLLNPVTGPNGEKQPIGPIGYTKPPQVPPALAALIQTSEADLADILGYNQAQQEKMVSNVSGKAVELIQQRVDMQAYIYMSNFGKAMRRAAEIWLSIAGEIYTERRRKMKAVDKYGDSSTVELMTPAKGEDGGLEYANDLSKAKFDVAYSVGPSSSSAKSATVRALTGMMQLAPDPQTQGVLAAAALMNMEGEGLGDIKAYFRKQLVMQGVVKPNEQEQEMMAEAAQNKQPDPQSAALLALAEKEQALAQRERANTLKTLADADKSRAQTIEILGAVDAQEAARAQALQATAQPPMGAME
jgi:23S rRNA maturation mini-RNase III